MNQTMQRILDRLPRLTLGAGYSQQRANEPLAASVRAHHGTGLTTAQINAWLANLGQQPRQGLGNYYQTSVPVYRAVKLRADAVSRARLKVYRRGREGRLEWLGEEHEVQQLLDRVNGTWTRNRMWRAVETYLGLWGSSFRWVNQQGTADLSQWEIWPLRPDRVQVVPGPDGEVAGYVFDPAGARFAMPAAEVIWDRYFNPLDELAGQSPLLAGRQSVEMQERMLDFNRQFFNSGLLASNLAFFLNGPLQPADLEEFYARLEERYGRGHQQRPIVFDRGQGDVKNLGLSNREMEFLEGIQLAKEHVADLYGVPEELMAGARHPTFSNREAALRDFYRNTVTQEWDLLAAEMQERFVPMLPARYQEVLLRFDISEIQELEESLAERTERNLKLIQAGAITINEWRESEGKPPVPWGNGPVAAAGPDTSAAVSAE